MVDEDIEEDFREMSRLCQRMQTALEMEDERRAYSFSQAIRGLAGAVLDPKHFSRINKAASFIEGAMDNGLWVLAEESGREYTAAVEAACKATRARLQVDANKR